MKHKKFYNYEVYENGDVYSYYRNKFLTKSIVQGYVQYTLYIDGKIKRIKAHRLVGLLFLSPPENYKDLVINHKDGNKLNNNSSNLEWCTQYYNNLHARVTGLNNISKSNHDRWKDKEFSEKTRKHMSEIALVSGHNAGKNNGRFKYEIFDKFGNEYSRIELAKKLGISQSYCDNLIRSIARKTPHKNQKCMEFGIIVIDTKKSQSTIESTQ